MTTDARSLVTDALNAHTPNSDGQWHSLREHLVSVATTASDFARAFRMPRLAYYVGLLHDLGKANPAFQRYLYDQHAGVIGSPKVPHSVWGAVFAAHTLRRTTFDGPWVEPVLVVLGHHAGLRARGVLGGEFNKSLKLLHAGTSSEVQAMIALIGSLPASRPFRRELEFDVATDREECRELMLRMLFSSLVDADRLDTEKHFNRSKNRVRTGWWPLASLWPAFRRDHVRKMAGRRSSSPVNRVRREVYRACRARAKLPSGVFRLAVPTGGGKTRSALAFALEHARAHPSDGFRRVIFALPFTSIVDQTVKEYRSIFPAADHVVLEHHSQVEVKGNENDQSHARQRQQLAEENWDAPLIVTTTVQLFESLLSDKPGKCRKLHNVARSIIVLDEVQALPPQILEPTLSVLRALVEQCGVTVVLCTATQPAFEDTPYLKSFSGLPITPIVSDVQAARHFLELKRVTYEWRPIPINWEELSKELAADDAPQWMVVLNTRRDALRLLDACGRRGAAGLIHLSTLLCGAHRRHVLDEVRRRLAAGKPVRLVSTQVVEAGVDLDFPLVYRAIGPLDRIIQAAGRCNREGRPAPGRVVIFEPAQGAVPRGSYKIGLEEARAILTRHKAEDLHNPALCREYFARMFGNLDLDEKGIQSLRREMNYPEVGRLYRLIEQDTVPVIVTSYDDGKGRRLLKRHLKKPSRETFRRLQPYVVSLYQHEADRLKDNGWLSEAGPSLLVWEGAYEAEAPHRGMMQALLDPSDLTTQTLEEAGWSI